MDRINYWSIVVAAAVAFVTSSLYYSPLLFGDLWRSVDPVAAAAGGPSAARVAVELGRTLIITFVLAQLMTMLGSSGWKSAAALALRLWFGFSAMMWIGAIMWEKTPWQIAAIHSGDWLAKTVLIASILDVWHRRSFSDITASMEKRTRNGEAGRVATR